MLAFSAARNRTAAERGALELKLGDAAAIPWPDETFGVLVCANAFFFFERPELVLAEFVRVLRRGGRLVIATQPGPLPPVSLRRWWLAVWGSAMHVYSDERMGKLLERAGSTQITIETKEGAQLARAVGPGSGHYGSQASPRVVLSAWARLWQRPGRSARRPALPCHQQRLCSRGLSSFAGFGGY